LILSLVYVIYKGIKTGEIKIENKYEHYYDDSEVELKEIE